MKRFYNYLMLLILLISASVTSSAQTFNNTWAKSFGSTGPDYGFTITTDNDGNSYVAGGFSGKVDFDPGNGVFNMTSNGSYDTYIMKLDANGNFVWARSYGSSGHEQPYCIASDDSANIYISGRFSGTVDFNQGGTAQKLTGSGVNDGYVLKLDSAGSFKWVSHVVKGSNNDFSYGIEVDNSGNVYYAGNFNASVADFQSGNGSTNLSNKGSRDMFVGKLNSSGQFQWVKQIAGKGDDATLCMTVDKDDNVIVAGRFSGTIDADPSSATQNHTANSGYDMLIVKLNSSGNYLWSSQLVGAQPYENWAWGISTDSKGNIYTSSKYSGTIDVDPGSNTQNVSSNGKTDILVHKLNSNGDYVWHKSIGGTGGDMGTVVDVDGDDNVYVTGFFENQVDFDPSNNTVNINSNGGLDLFLIKLDSVGDYQWVKAVYGPKDIVSQSINVNNGYVYISGKFMNKANFHPFINNTSLTSNGDWDVLVCKLSQSMGTLNSNLVFKQTQITGFPNPFNNVLKINSKSVGLENIQMFDINGKLIFNVDANGKQYIEVNTSNVSTGTYFLKVTDESRNTNTLKFIKY